MIALTLAALMVAAPQTIVLPVVPEPPSQAMPATASSPQVKTPDPSTVAAPAGTTPLVAQPQGTPMRPSTPPIVPQTSAAGASASSSSQNTRLNTRDRTALPTAVTPSSVLPAGVTGGPTFGGTTSIQTGGH